MEVLVTLVVLGTGIVLLAQGLTAGIRAASRAERLTRAVQVADEIFERMAIGEIDFQTQTEGSLDEIGPGDDLESETEAYRSAYRWRSQVETGVEENLFEVTLVVTWDDLGEEAGRSFEATRLFYVPPDEETE